jgi:ATP-dependent helicase STH1/SNF2
MQARGATEANNPEFAQTLRAFQQQQNIAAVSAGNSGSGSINGSESADAGKTSSSTVTTSTMNAQSSQAPTPLSADQLMSLKYQILAFKLISRNYPVPPLLQQAMFNPSQLQGLSAQDLVGSIPGKIVEAANAHHTQQAPPTASTPSADIGSSPNPTGSNSSYNSYTNPHTYLKRVDLSSHASRQQRMLIPAIMPVGLDPQDIAAERERDINFRRQQRIHELQQYLMNNEDENIKIEENHNRPNSKIKAMIELKGLRLLDKQRRV